MSNKINYAIIGNGKTGQYVVELLKDLDNVKYTIFNSKNHPTEVELIKHDVIICFLPGDIFLSYLPLLKACKKPIIIGSTGFTWPINLNSELMNLQLKWIWSHNFSLGMNLVKSLIDKISKSQSMFEDIKYQITETHHTHKKDAPSGTAKEWKKWLDVPSDKVNIKSIRKGDEIGTHQLDITTEFEDITLTHRAKSRKIFASGAIYAANLLIEKKLEMPFGLHNFSDII